MSNKKLLVFITVILLLIPLPLSARNYTKKGDSSPVVISTEEAIDLSTITVTGSGKSTGSDPDLANLSITISTKGKTAKEATSKNASTSQSVLNILSSIGIPKKDIETTGFNVSIDYDFINGESKIVGYIATNALQVEVIASKVGEVIDSVTEEDVSIGGIGYKLNVENSKKKQNEALENAVKEARGKAEAIAKAAGVNIIGIKSINESFSVGIVPFQTGIAEATTPKTEIIPGEITASASVSISFIIDD